MSAIAVAGVVSAGIGAYASNKAAKTAAEAMKSSQVDIDALDAKARTLAKRNAIESMELERQLTPEVADLRKGSIEQLNQGLGPDKATEAAKDSILARLGQDVAGPAYSPLLKAAIAKAKADLELGGGLDVETRNLVARKAMANAGTNTGNLRLAGDLTARDLGLTSLQLQQERLRQAAALGGQEQEMEEFNTGTKFNNASNLINQIQLLQALSGGDFSKRLAAAQFGQSIAPPVVGLDPGSVVDLTVGNSNNTAAAAANKANIQGQQSSNFMNFGGQLLGGALLNYNNKKTPTPAASTVPAYLQKTGPSYASSLPRYGP